MDIKDFENLTFNTFNKENILLNDSFDLDHNFFNRHGFTNTTYFTPETLKTMIIMTSHFQSSILISEVQIKTLKTRNNY